MNLVAELERLQVDFPEVPDLDVALGRLGCEVYEPRRVRWVAAFAAAAALVLVVYGPTRQAVADWFGLGVIEIVQVPHVTVPEIEPEVVHSEPTVEVAPLPPDVLEVLGDMGDAVAVETIGLEWPPAFGPPDEAFERPGELWMVWIAPDGVLRNDDGALLYELRPIDESGVVALVTRFDGDLDGPALQKGIGPGTSVREVTVGGRLGFWIEGEAHAIGYLDPDGQLMFETQRLAGNTLLWETDDAFFRLESALTMDEAIAVAESVG